MTTRRTSKAFGGVVLREHHGSTQVAIIHRQRYDDWSLPKGKPKEGETAPLTAVREIREETGLNVVLGATLGTVRYPVKHMKKHATFWRCTVNGSESWKPNREVDRVEWVSAEKALRKLTYAGEREMVRRALAWPPTVALLIVRHGKALPRKHWRGPDHLRELNKRGRRQARELIDVLGAYGVSTLVSSSATRCMQTLTPYAHAHHLKIQSRDALTEEEGNSDGKKVVRVMRKLVRQLREPTAVCGHRPVLPRMFKAIGVDRHQMIVGETVVAHVADDGTVIATESIKLIA